METRNITLVVGDWSGDGHGQTHNVIISTNLTVAEIVKAYVKGKETLGFDLEDFCSEYEDSILPQRVADEIVKLSGLPFKEGELDDDDMDMEDLTEPHYFMDTDLYARLWCGVVKIGNPAFQFQFITGEEIHIGGYGLFE